jgi:FAD:protein FMN transferase
MSGLVVLLASPLLAPVIGSPQPALFHHQAARMSMACLYAIEAYGPDAQALPGAVEDAFDEVDRIDRLMSHYKPESPLSRINQQAARGPVAVERELFDFIAESMRYSRESDGAFDITVGPLMKAWGFFRGEGRMPSSEELDGARRHVGASHVVLDQSAQTIAFDEAGVELDLGGIAKGYAVDRAVALLKARHVAAALVTAGGSTIYGLGAPPRREGWAVELQDPLHSSAIARTVSLKNRSLSVAGSSEKYFEVDGRRYSHIMDPRTGRPVEGMLSVAVLTDTGLAGDALDDAFFVLGPEKSQALIARHPGTEVFFFQPGPGGSWNMVHSAAR